MGWLVLLFLISIICLFLGLIKPKIFSRILGNQVSRKTIVLLFGGAIVVLFVVIGSSGPKSRNEINIKPMDQVQVESNSTAPSATTSPIITQKVQDVKIEPLKLKGTGPKATDFFRLDKGLKRFTITHDGTGYFGVVLMDDKGDKVDRLVNDLSPYNGSKALKISQTGNYLLNIEANGNWTVTIE